MPEDCHRRRRRAFRAFNWRPILSCSPSLSCTWRQKNREKKQKKQKNNEKRRKNWKKKRKKWVNKTRRSTMRPQATFSFFIFLQLFHFFTLLVAPSSSSLLPPRPSFLLVPPSSLFLFLPRPALSQSLRIHKRPFFIEFDKSVTDGPTNGPTDGLTLL